mgnify:CR=1 FL=1
MPPELKQLSQGRLVQNEAIIIAAGCGRYNVRCQEGDCVQECRHIGAWMTYYVVFKQIKVNTDMFPFSAATLCKC